MEGGDKRRESKGERKGYRMRGRGGKGKMEGRRQREENVPLGDGIREEGKGKMGYRKREEGKEP